MEQERVADIISASTVMFACMDLHRYIFFVIDYMKTRADLVLVGQLETLWVMLIMERKP